MINKALFSATTVEWATPQNLFDELNAEFHFSLDVCANAQNKKCRKFYSPAENGLSQKWSNSNWMNPPYERKIVEWIAKAHKEALNGNKTVALLPARTDTRGFHDYIYQRQEIRFLKGRLKFGQSKNSAPFPSMIVVFS